MFAFSGGSKIRALRPAKRGKHGSAFSGGSKIRASRYIRQTGRYGRLGAGYGSIFTMIRAYHVIFTAYGFWLPNDPRGSWSDFVRSWELYGHGSATKTDARRSVAGVSHDRARRLAAKSDMRHESVRFTGEMARCIGSAFAEVSTRLGYRIHACSIMPDHVHLVVDRHRYRVEQVVRCLKQAATSRLRDEGFTIEPSSPWARRLWKVYLNDTTDIRRAMRYVEQNPVKSGLPPQRWSCVTPFDG